jgi:hypothetical protein
MIISKLLSKIMRIVYKTRMVVIQKGKKKLISIKNLLVHFQAVSENIPLD